MNPYLTFLYNHSTVILAAGGFLFKTGVNAFPPKGEPFQFGQWFMEWMREVGQQKGLNLDAAQHQILNAAGRPAK